MIRKALDGEHTAPRLLDAIKNDQIVGLILKSRPQQASTTTDRARRAEERAELDTGFVAALADRYHNLAKAVLGPEAGTSRTR